MSYHYVPIFLLWIFSYFLYKIVALLICKKERLLLIQKNDSKPELLKLYFNPKKQDEDLREYSTLKWICLGFSMAGGLFYVSGGLFDMRGASDRVQDILLIKSAAVLLLSAAVGLLVYYILAQLLLKRKDCTKKKEN